MIRVRVEGHTETARKFRSLDRKSRDLSGAWRKIGADIKGDAVSLVPTVSGRLASSIRANKAKTKSTVSAGGARVPYAGPINYGWPARNIEATHFLNEALDKNEDNARNEVLREMQRLIRAAGL